MSEPTVDPRATTPVFGWHVPVLGDVPNMPADITALATGIEGTLVSRTGVNVAAGVKTIAAGGTSITYSGFAVDPVIVATVIRDHPDVTNQVVTVRTGATATSAILDVRNSAGTSVGGTVYWIAAGGRPALRDVLPDVDTPTPTQEEAGS